MDNYGINLIVITADPCIMISLLQKTELDETIVGTNPIKSILFNQAGKRKDRRKCGWYTSRISMMLHQYSDIIITEERQFLC